ncbi:MAG: DUF3995 domain-containing protein [Nannocystaceae bacterium]
MISTVVAAGFALLAVAHSLLGEHELLRPLFAQPWQLPIPRWAAERVFRFAWHLTSLAWLGLAALALGTSPSVVLGAVALGSGLVVFVMLRGHLAWPIFFATALAAGLAGGGVGPGVLAVVCSSAAIGLLAVGLLHIGWALGGGTRMLAVAIPTDDQGRPRLHPPRWMILAVALGLLGAAAVLGSHVLGGRVPGQGTAALAMTVVFSLRAIGDFRYVGLSKPGHESPFERLDDAVYTPLSVLFAFGGAAALLL